MATPQDVFLSNATITITQGATSYVLSDMANQCTLTVGREMIDITAFGDTGRRSAPGLQSVDASITFFLNYGANEVEDALAACVGTGTTTLVISPSGTTEGPSNPEYTIQNCMLQNFTPINSTVGEIATVVANFVNGTWGRDVTAP